MFSRILCPIDFSDRSRGAARAAHALARRFHSDIVALHVVPENNPARIAEAESKLGELLAQEMKGCTIFPLTAAGDPAGTIVQFVHDRQADLVVIPTHGLSPFRQFQLGSVSTKVLRLASCPVWTCSHLEDWPVVETIPIRAVLCALDFGPRSCSALQWAARMAREFSAKLMLAHVVRPGEDHLPEMPEHTLRRQQERLQLPSDTRILEGPPAQMLSGLAEECAADLMVIGRTHASSAGLGANAYAIIAHSPCPVLSV